MRRMERDIFLSSQITCAKLRTSFFFFRVVIEASIYIFVYVYVEQVVYSPVGIDGWIGKMRCFREEENEERIEGI